MESDLKFWEKLLPWALSFSAWIMALLALAAVCLVMFLGSAKAENYGPYRAQVTKVYDGDTFTAWIYIFPGLIAERSVRLNGVDTPELRGKCPQEKEAAQRARARARELIEKSGNMVSLTYVLLGKYAGRVVADVSLSNGADLASMLISEGLGRPYDGGKRAGWCGPNLDD
jgi:endonuclease YncB( thermonuclease family)